MTAKIRLYFILLFCALHCRCATAPSYSKRVEPISRPDYLIREYTPTETWIEKSMATNSDRSRHVELIPQGEPGFPAPLVLDYYPPRDPKPSPGLLVSPILGGKNTVADHFARRFAREGYHCIVVHRPKDLTRDTDSPQVLDNKLRNAILRDRIALDWLERQPGVDPDALGSFGISYGGIKNVVLAGVERRLKVNVFALAGADLASIISRSNLKNLRKMREQVMQQNNWSREDFEYELRNTVRTEPLRFTHYINPDTTMLILARMDHTVPRRNGEILREALSFPETLYLPAGHYSGLLLTGLIAYPYIENQVVDFLDDHLKPLAKDEENDEGKQ